MRGCPALTVSRWRLWRLATGGEDQVVVHQVALGSFLNNAKARRAKLTPGQLAERGVERV